MPGARWRRGTRRLEFKLVGTFEGWKNDTPLKTIPARLSLRHGPRALKSASRWQESVSPYWTLTGVRRGRGTRAPALAPPRGVRGRFRVLAAFQLLTRNRPRPGARSGKSGLVLGRGRPPSYGCQGVPRQSGTIKRILERFELASALL